MTSLLTAAPGSCARFGVAVLLAALADFFFYGQPVGITLFLFGMTLAAAAAAIQPSALSAGRAWFKAVALLVGLLPLLENVSALSVAIGLVAMAVFALSLSGGCGAGLPALPARSRCSCSQRRFGSSTISSAGARRRGGLVGGASASRRSPSGSCR